MTIYDKNKIIILFAIKQLDYKWKEIQSTPQLHTCGSAARRHKSGQTKRERCDGGQSKMEEIDQRCPSTLSS